MANPANTLESRDASKIYISKRSSSSSSSSDKCDSSSAGSCEKPTTDNGLTIGLGVGIPAAVIILVLGFFLFKNYRKEKKENSEHDPDFDETGEATALPDFPYTKGYGFEDPFHNRNSVRYPSGAYKMEDNVSSSSIPQTVQGNVYIDNFFLPYQHNKDSKVSLDDYARQLDSFPSIGNSIRASGVLSRSTHSVSSMSQFTPAGPASSVSPQKSNLKAEIKASEILPNSTTKQNYTNIPNYSFSQADLHESDNDSNLESVSNSDSDDSFTEAALGKEKFEIKYENESDLAINRAAPSQKETDLSKYTHSLNETATNESYGTTQEEFDKAGNENALNSHQNSDAYLDDNDNSTILESTNHSVDKYPFGDENNHDVENSSGFGKEEEEGDFDFSSRNQNLDSNIVYGTAEHEEKIDTSRLDPNSSDSKISKSPRISAFDLLRNDSDDENDENKEVTTEQEEEIKRMKSVYKVYFDRANSQKTVKTQHQDNKEFAFDQSEPLPQLSQELDEVRINKDLKVDTTDKRITTTSSIYTEVPIFDENTQEYHYQRQYPTYQEQPYQQMGNYYAKQKPELPPLQQLPNASDIRNSTIQTYTEFFPKAKNNPSNKMPFNPIENDDIWNSPMSSPVFQSQASFTSHQSTSPVMSHNTPSASQLSRSSVVMLNPVTEITTNRKFTPAGSIGKNATPNHSLTNQSLGNQQYFSQNVSQSENDLIPGNRKSEIRRMMNSNF